MPTATEFVLGLPEKEKIHRAMGSILQGAIMEILDSESADKLHVDGLRPYSQYLYFDKNKNLPVWRVNSLNDWAHEKISVPLTRQRQIFLRHKNYCVNLLEHKIIAAESYADIVTKFMNEDAPTCRGVDLEFVTTTSFRRDGQYVIFPELYLIIQSLLNRWNKFAEGFFIEEDISKVMATFCRVTEYDLRTQNFLLEHQKFLGFCGKMKIKFYGNRIVNNLLDLLSNYANYSGVGIKTALGMGAVRIRNFSRKLFDS